MLSLKKAALEPTGLWSLTTMQGVSGGVRPEGRVTRFASRVPGEPHRVFETTACTQPDDGVIELGNMQKGP